MQKSSVNNINANPRVILAAIKFKNLLKKSSSYENDNNDDVNDEHEVEQIDATIDEYVQYVFTLKSLTQIIT